MSEVPNSMIPDERKYLGDPPDCPKCGKETVSVEQLDCGEGEVYVHEWTYTESMGPIAEPGNCCPDYPGANDE